MLTHVQTTSPPIRQLFLASAFPGALTLVSGNPSRPYCLLKLMESCSGPVPSARVEGFVIANAGSNYLAETSNLFVACVIVVPVFVHMISKMVQNLIVFFSLCSV